MSDIFREVEEDVRRERFQKLWKQYGDYAIAALAVVVIAVAGYKFWERYESQQRLNASTSFSAAQQLADSGNNAAAAQAYGKLAKSAPGGYSAMALLARADALLASGNHSDAVALYKSIATKDSSPVANVARIRAAWAIVEFTPKSELETWLAPMTDPTSAWRYMAREILAYADYRAGAFKQAQAEYESLAADTNATRTLRGRTNAMAVFLKGGGDKNFGTVPRPAPPAAAAPTNNPKGQTSP